MRSKNELIFFDFLFALLVLAIACCIFFDEIFSCLFSYDDLKNIFLVVVSVQVITLLMILFLFKKVK